MNSALRHHAGGGRSGSDLLPLCRGCSNSFSAWFSPNNYIITARFRISSCYSSKFQVIVPTMARSRPFISSVLEICRIVETSGNKHQLLLDISMNHWLLIITVILLIFVFVLVFVPPPSRSSRTFRWCVF